MLFGSTLLEVAIGVIFIYLLLSMLCSALSELIEAYLNYRAKDLEMGITRLLGNKALVEKFFSHPLVKPMGENPSYIPASTFSLALWNLATGGAEKVASASAGVTQNVNQVRGLIASLDDATYKDVKASLLTLIDEAGGDIDRARANIEGWYNDAMDRVSGWYKRRVHKRLIIIGFIAATILNVDTITIAKVLWYNDTLRASVTAAAEDYVKTNPAPAPSPSPEGQGGAAAAPAGSAQDPSERANLARKKINDIRGELDKLGLPISWSFRPDKEDDEKYKALQEPERGRQYERDMEAWRVDPRRFPGGGYGWFLKVLGLLLTALAVSQGAPFWFDMLNKVIVIRSTVKPREKSPPQPSKDKPAPETTKQQPEPPDEKKEGDEKPKG